MPHPALPLPPVTTSPACDFVSGATVTVDAGYCVPV
jgi:hypothetical protein